MAHVRLTGPTTGDLVAGVSVALLFIPQAVGLAALAGLPPEQGLYAAALAPIATALTSSSPYLQAGPTAMTSLLTLGALAPLAATGSPRFVALAALLALVVGAVRIGIGLIRAGVVAYLMSQPVVVGFTAAAGVLIVLSQIPPVLGVVSGDTGHPAATAFEALRHAGSWDPGSIVLGGLALVLILGGRRVHPLFPGVLLAAVGAIAYSALTDFAGPTVGSVRSGFPPVSIDLPWSDVGRLLVPGIVIAIVGFAEPAAIARHYATAERERWDPNRELVSQGLSNVLAGFGSGYPVGGSFSRSALNKLAGAESRWSSAATAIVVLAFLPVMGVIAPLPRSVVGATVIAAVLSLLDPRPFLEYRRTARLQFNVAVITFATTLLVAPHVERGVVVGVALAVAAHLWRELRLSTPAWFEGDTLHVQPRGVLYFASAPGLEDAVGNLLHEHRDARRLVVHLDGLGRVDLTGALVLRGVLADARAAGLEVEVRDVPPQAKKIVGRVLAGQAPISPLVEGGRFTPPAPRARRPRRG
jgi:SulP family sulfate permease